MNTEIPEGEVAPEVPDLEDHFEFAKPVAESEVEDEPEAPDDYSTEGDDE